MALQGDTCTKKSINAIHIAAVAAGKSDEEINEMYNVEGAIQLDLTDNQFKMIGDDLNKEHASEKVQHAIKIFRGHQKGASPEEAKSAAVSYNIRTQHQKLTLDHYLTESLCHFSLVNIFTRLIRWCLKQMP